MSADSGRQQPASCRAAAGKRRASCLTRRLWKWGRQVARLWKWVRAATRSCAALSCRMLRQQACTRPPACSSWTLSCAWRTEVEPCGGAAQVSKRRPAAAGLCRGSCA